MKAQVLGKENPRENFSVRSALPADVAAIAALDRRMWGNWANSESLYRQLVDLYPETVLVAYSEAGEYAGCAVGLIRTKPEIGWVLSVDLDEKFRGQGLGKRFISELLQAFKRLGIELAVAMIDPDNIASQKAFGALGFRKTQSFEDYLGQGKDHDRWELNLD